VPAISVVPFRLLLDRNIGVSEAVSTSIRVVLTKRRPMLPWGLIVTARLLGGLIPFFVGEGIVPPVLGHTTR